MLMPDLMLMLIPPFWEFITYETVEDGLKIVEHVVRLPPGSNRPKSAGDSDDRIHVTLPIPFVTKFHKDLNDAISHRFTVPARVRPHISGDTVRFPCRQVIFMSPRKLQSHAQRAGQLRSAAQPDIKSPHRCTGGATGADTSLSLTKPTLALTDMRNRFRHGDIPRQNPRLLRPRTVEENVKSVVRARQLAQRGDLSRHTGRVPPQYTGRRLPAFHLVFFPLPNLFDRRGRRIAEEGLKRIDLPFRFDIS